MRDYDHHAKQKRDRIEIDGAKGFLEAQGTNRDHRGSAEKGDPRTIETRHGNAADRNANIGQDEDDERRDAFECHSPAAAPSIARGWGFCLMASSSRVSGMKPKKTKNATAAATPKARNETL